MPHSIWNQPIHIWSLNKIVSYYVFHLSMNAHMLHWGFLAYKSLLYNLIGD